MNSQNVMYKLWSQNNVCQNFKNSTNDDLMPIILKCRIISFLKCNVTPQEFDEGPKLQSFFAMTDDEFEERFCHRILDIFKFSPWKICDDLYLEPSDFAKSFKILSPNKTFTVNTHGLLFY